MKFFLDTFLHWRYISRIRRQSHIFLLLLLYWRYFILWAALLVYSGRAVGVYGEKYILGNSVWRFHVRKEKRKKKKKKKKKK